MSIIWKAIIISLGCFWALGPHAFADEAQKTLPVLFHPTGEVTHQELRPQTQGIKTPSYVADQILVKFKADVPESSIASAHAGVQANIVKKFDVVKNLHLVKLPHGLSMQKTLAAYRRNPHVLYAEPNYRVKTLAVPNDPSFSSLWHLQNTGQNGGTPGADIDAPNAWDISTGSSNVVVAVIDIGVDYNHQDLSANMWKNTADCNNNGIDDDGNGYIDDCYGIDTFNHDSDPMDDNDHGTHVSGIIGAVGNNGLGVVGVNWNVSIMACKFVGADGDGYISGAIECLDYVKTMKDRGVNIVATSNSWVSTDYSQALFEAIDAHRQRGILCIAAAGNDGQDNDVNAIYPANYYLPNIISVTATDHSDGLAYFSTYGRRTVHLGAPGVDILSTGRGNRYYEDTGTSMATPFVTGVAALLKAQNPARDWKTIKNLILAGGDTISSLTNTITQKRLNAFGAMTCSNSVILSRLLPVGNTINGTIGVAIDLSVLHINCATPNGEVVVIVNPGGQVVTLKDDGLGNDQSAGDGIYSGQWTPSAGGTFTLTFPEGDLVSVMVDPDLEPGFPVKAYQSEGSYHEGPAVHTLVGNIDDDPKLEIVVTGLGSGPLFAWHSDGSPVVGWPDETETYTGAAYPAMGNLSITSSGFEVFSGYGDGSLVAYSGSGNVLPGWPRNSANTISSPAALADVDGDGLDEIFIGEEDGQLHSYKADGSLLPGWPVGPYVGGQERRTPAISDLDGDGNLEIVTAADGVLLAYHYNGVPVNGFPISFDSYADTYPVIGDVDGDGALEIVVAAKISGNPGVLIFSSNGILKRSLPLSGTISNGTAPALADLDNDGIPEIIVQTNEALNVVRGDGSIFPGWPVTFQGNTYWAGNSSPVVGDVDGDGMPDIVVTNQIAESSEWGEVRVYNRYGILHSHFPKTLKIGAGAVPAIADIDRDGRNEIIISGDYWNGYSGYYDKVWVYNLGGPPHGPIHWGQFMGGPKHQGFYVLPPVTTGSATDVTQNSATLNGFVNPNGLSTTYYFQWGTTTAYGNETSTQSAGSGISGVAVTANLNDLAPNTTYHYRLVATNSSGTSYGSDMTFTTSTVPSSVTTGIATNISSNSATLNGTVNANNASTIVTFQYGFTNTYGTTVTADQSPVTGNSDTAVSKAITGLNENTTYHYQVVGVNSAGTTNGGDLTLTILADTTPPALDITSHSNGQHATTSSITLSGTASDAGKGENGIQQVTVNGSRASNDTATGIGTANWNKAVTLNAGANSITVMAYDNSTNHNTATTMLTIYYDITQAPSVTTGPAANVTEHSAILTGTVNPNGLSTTYYFQWGPTTSYGNTTSSQSAGSGWDNVAVSANITGLTLHTNYHYRLVAASSAGTTYGSDVSFIASVKTLPWLMLLLGN